MNPIIEGVGLGLRFQHFDDIPQQPSTIQWFEVMADDFLTPGPHFAKLEKLRMSYPIVFHSVGMNLGGVDPWDESYLKHLKDIYHRFQPAWISDHLCWSSHNGKYHHDLLPIPPTHEGMDNVCDRIDQIQNIFQRPLAIENITRYMDYKTADFSDLEFLLMVLERTGCQLLLDISNVNINCQNRGEDPIQWLDKIPLQRVKQVHLAGGHLEDNLWIDSHSQPIFSSDLDLLKTLIGNGLQAPVMIERDANIPSYADLVLEGERVTGVLNDELQRFSS